MMKQVALYLSILAVMPIIGAFAAGCDGDGQPAADGDTDADTIDVSDGDDVIADGDVDIADGDADEGFDDTEEPHPCVNSAECPSGYYCDSAAGRCVSGECYDRRDCDALEDCDVLNHTCFFVGCSRDDECEGRCYRAVGQCVQCLRDGDCPGGICLRESHTCTDDGCEDDPLEPNDDARGASPVQGGVYDKLRLCSGDEDWYTLFMSVGSGLTVHVEVARGESLDLALFDAEETAVPLSSVTITRSGDLVLQRANISGDYLLAASGGNGVEYAMTVAVQHPTDVCGDDAFEDNDTMTTATAIGEGSFTGLMACPGDPDMFALILNRGDMVNATLTGQGTQMVLWDDDRGVVATATGSPVSLQATAPASGRYFLRITADDAAASYALSWGRTPAAITCNDDGIEDNDTAQTAARIAGGALENLVSCGGDADWYHIAESGASASITLFADRYHPFAVYAAGAPGVPLDQSWPDTADASVARMELDYMPPEGLLIQVPPAADDAAVSYDLLWEIAAAGCSDDRLEDNDTPENATLTDSAVYDGLRACAGDDDWYAVMLNAGDILDIYAAFDQRQGDLDLDVFNPEGERIAAGHTITDDEEATITASVSGFYYFVMYGWRDAQADYDLAVDIRQATVYCPEDRFEDNDSPATAALLEEPEVYDLQICPGDSDFYAIALNQGDELSLGIFFVSYGGILFAELLAPDGQTVVATGEDVNGDQIVGTTATVSGAYILKVYGANAAIANSYDLIVDITPGVSACTDDAWENNDSAQTAIMVAEGSLENLVICPHDNDWFGVYLGQGDSLRAGITMDNPDAGDLDLLLIGPDGHLVLDSSASMDATEIVSLQNAPQNGVYLLKIEGYLGDANTYSLSVTVEGVGGRQGSVTRSVAPGAALSQDTPVLIEMPFDRVPAGAVVDRLVIDDLWVDHAFVGDLVITASFGQSGDMLLWNRQGGAYDGGADDDEAEDADIELYDHSLNAAAGLPAGDTLLMLFEDEKSGDDGTLHYLEVTLWWKLP